MIESIGQLPMSQMSPSLMHMIEDAILLGKQDDLEKLVELVAEHPDVPAELYYGLEGLKYFRAHYQSPETELSALARQRVAQFDTSWSMQLIDMLHDGQAESYEKQEKIA